MSVLAAPCCCPAPPLQTQSPPCSQSTATPMPECFLILRQGFAKFTRLVLNSLTPVAQGCVQLLFHFSQLADWLVLQAWHMCS